MPTLTNIYSDIDLTFSPQPTTGDISLVLDDRAVINSVRNLLLTNFYERPWQPGLGSNMTGLLFELVTPLMQNIIQTEITNVINNFEPRVAINNITVTADAQNDGYDISMSFYIGNNTTPTDVNLFLERIR